MPRLLHSIASASTADATGPVCLTSHGIRFPTLPSSWVRYSLTGCGGDQRSRTASCSCLWRCSRSSAWAASSSTATPPRSRCTLTLSQSRSSYFPYWPIHSAAFFAAPGRRPWGSLQRFSSFGRHGCSWSHKACSEEVLHTFLL